MVQISLQGCLFDGVFFGIGGVLLHLNNMIHSIYKQDNALGNKPLELREGQIVYGKLNQLFPQNLAEVQVGSQKMLAHLSIPLSIDKKYWFQVGNNEDKLHLKVLTEINGAESDKNSSLLKQLSLPETKENKAIMAHFLSKQLPITKEIMGNVSDWLTGSVNMKKDLSNVQLMLERELPFTETIFHSLSSVQSGKSVSQLTTELQQQLQNLSMEEQSLQKILPTIIEGAIITESSSDSTIQSIKEVLLFVRFC